MFRKKISLFSKHYSWLKQLDKSAFMLYNSSGVKKKALQTA